MSWFGRNSDPENQPGPLYCGPKFSLPFHFYTVIMVIGINWKGRTLMTLMSMNSLDMLVWMRLAMSMHGTSGGGGGGLSHIDEGAC